MHELQHALDGIAVCTSVWMPSSFMRDVGAVSTTVWALTVPIELMYDPVFRDGEQDLHRDGVHKRTCSFPAR